MALPKKLKDFNLFGDGNNWQGQIAEITLPELARKLEDYRAGGMDGTVQIDQGMEAITMEWTSAGLIDGVFDGFGAPINNNMLRFTGSYERDDDGSVAVVEIVVRGRHSKIAMGTAKAGDDNSIAVTTNASYYKLTIDGKEIIEVDVLGYIFKVNGVDRLAERRKALGI